MTRRWAPTTSVNRDAMRDIQRMCLELVESYHFEHDAEMISDSQGKLTVPKSDNCSTMNGALRHVNLPWIHLSIGIHAKNSTIHKVPNTFLNIAHGTAINRM